MHANIKEGDSLILAYTLKFACLKCGHLQPLTGKHLNNLQLLENDFSGRK